MLLKIILLYLTLIPVAQSDDNFSKTEYPFPQNIVIKYANEQFELRMTGRTIRKKFFMNIYSMAHYIQQREGFINPDDSASDIKIYKTILQHSTAKQISMIFMRKLSAEQIQKSLRSGIKLNSNDDEYLQIQPQVEEFIQAINSDVKKNDEFTLRWLPDGTVISLFQGQQISSIRDMKFAQTLWAIWFGQSSIVNRKDLIEELLTSS